jgi:surface antigen
MSPLRWLPLISGFAKPFRTQHDLNTHPRRRHPASFALARVSSFVLVVVALVVGSATPASAASYSRTVSGTITCSSGQKFVGAWVENADGGGDGFADWSYAAGSTTTASFSRTVTSTRPDPAVKVNIGCGGSTASWAKTLFTPTFRVKAGQSRDFWCTSSSAGNTTACWPNRLYAGEKMVSGRQVYASNGAYRLVMQSDGNLVLYKGSTATWSTKTSGSGNYAVVQSDGNFVVYSSGGTARWSSKTSGWSGPVLGVSGNGRVDLRENFTWNGSTKSKIVWMSTAGIIRTTGGPSGVSSDPCPGTTGTYSGYYKGECTCWAAYMIRKVHGINFTNWFGGSNFGNGATWGAAARAEGITVNTTPAVGSIAYIDDGSFGHVAYVTAVSGTNVTVSEYNWIISSSPLITDHKLHTRTYDKSKFTGFIHFEAL